MKLCCPRAEDRVIFEDLRLRGQGQGLDLPGQGHELQNVSVRTPPLLLSRLLSSLLFFPAQIYSVDKIKLISAQGNDPMQ